jgi:hypothetical protein
MVLLRESVIDRFLLESMEISYNSQIHKGPQSSTGPYIDTDNQYVAIK